MNILSEEDADLVLAKVDRFAPHTIVMFASAAEIICQRARAKGWRPRKLPHAVITGAEILFENQRRLIEETFGCPAFETYGSREFMLIACECEAHDGMHISGENLMVEVCQDGQPAAQGELGELLITDLHNYAQPFIRYRNHDMSSWRSFERCACGRYLPRLNQVEGRLMDMITAPDGRRLTGLFFPHLLKDYNAIVRYQIVQDQPDHIVIRVKLASPLDPADAQTIVSKFEETLPGVQAELREVAEIEVAPTGKVRTTIGLGQSRPSPGSLNASATAGKQQR